MRKIGIIGTNGLPARYGGWEMLVQNLCNYLKDDFKIYVYTSSISVDEKPKNINGINLKYIPLKANGFQSIVYDIVSMIDAVRYCDTLLILGISGCIFLPFIKPFKKKIVINPDGLEWKRNKWNKFIKGFLKYSEKIAIKYSNEIVSDNKIIQEYIKNTYNKESNLIEYGSDHATYQSINRRNAH